MAAPLSPQNLAQINQLHPLPLSSRKNGLASPSSSVPSPQRYMGGSPMSTYGLSPGSGGGVTNFHPSSSAGNPYYPPHMMYSPMSAMNMYWGTPSQMMAMMPPSPYNRSGMQQQQQNANVCVNLFPTMPSPTAQPSKASLLPMPQRLEEIRQAYGSITQAACAATGRSLVQSVLHDGAASILLEEFIAELDTIALDANGCHVLRTLLESLPDQLVQGIVACFKETLVLNMCTLAHQTRLPLLHLFERPGLDVQHLVEVLCNNVQYLAATQQGVIALNKMFQLANPAQKGMIVSPVVVLLGTLATDPIGNYFVQCVVEHSGKVPAARYVAEVFAGHVVELSKNKFASNVMEKVVRCVNVPVVRKRMMDELCLTAGSDTAVLSDVLCDSYANFVVQALIDTATTPAELKRLSDRLKPLLAASPYATKIESRLKTKMSSTPQKSTQQ